MEMLEKLSPEQELKMNEVKQYWLDYIFSCKNSIDREKAKISIDWLYKFCGLDAPIIIYTNSPMDCQYATVYVKELTKHIGKNSSQVRSQVEPQVLSQVLSQVRSQVLSQVRSQVESQGLNYESFCSYGSVSDFGWASFYDFFTQIGVINNKDFNEFKSLLSSGIYDMIQLNGFCIVCDMPKTINRNESNELHSLTSPAIEWDGYHQHYVKGRFIPENYFKSISEKTFTITDFINEKNEEHKSSCIAMMQETYGDDYLIDFFRENLKEVDTFIDKKDDQFLAGTTKGMNVGVYTLFKGEINGSEIAYVRCFCPSTDRMFFLGVDEQYNNAKDAIASLYRIPSKLKSHIKSISRQGERFSTILTDKGNELLKSLSEEEIQSVDCITGSEYFSLMKYEY